MAGENREVGWNWATLKRVAVLRTVTLAALMSVMLVSFFALPLITSWMGPEGKLPNPRDWAILLLYGVTTFVLLFAGIVRDQMGQLRSAQEASVVNTRIAEAARRATALDVDPAADREDSSEVTGDQESGVREPESSSGPERPDLDPQRYDLSDDPPHIAMALIIRDRLASTQEKIDAAKAIAELQTADHRRHRLDAVTRVVTSIVTAAAVLGAAWIGVSLATSGSDAETPDPLVVVVLTAMPEATGTATPGAE